MAVPVLAAPVPLRKRIFDLALTIPAVLVLLPVMLLIALLVRLFLGRPVLFVQKRAGYRGQVFNIYKFRSMKDELDARGKPLPDEVRLTPLGNFLRQASLDELPEFYNVLKGDMSLVGPRPLYAHYLSRYSPEQNRRHSVLPGITGWAQVNGRNALDWDEKFSLDLWYIDHWSILLDVKILLHSVWKVLKREGISQEGQATAEEFTGPSTG
jgi:sugar transferase EpsL